MYFVEFIVSANFIHNRNYIPYIDMKREKVVLAFGCYLINGLVEVCFN